MAGLTHAAKFGVQLTIALPQYASHVMHTGKVTKCTQGVVVVVLLLLLLFGMTTTVQEQ